MNVINGLTKSICLKNKKTPQEKTPEQIVAEGDEKRAEGGGLRDDERETYNKAQDKLNDEEFAEGKGPAARALEREIKERQEQREKAQEKIQQRIQQLEKLVAARQSQIEDIKKAIAGLNESWSSTSDTDRRSSLHLATSIKEQSLPYIQKELDQYSKELEEQKLEMEKSKL